MTDPLEQTYKAMTREPDIVDIVKRLREVRGDNADAREAAAEIKRLRDDYSILKQDYDALRAQLADIRAALEPKP